MALCPKIQKYLKVGWMGKNMRGGKFQKCKFLYFLPPR